MVDVTPVQNFLLEVIPAVVMVGVAALGIAWLPKVFRHLRETLSYGLENGHGLGFVFLSESERVEARRDDEYDEWRYQRDEAELRRMDDDSARRQCGLPEFQDTVPSQMQPRYRPATAEEQASWDRINAQFDAQEAADAAFFGAMTPHEKYLAKATPEDLARDAELEAEAAAEDERIARKYGQGGTHQSEIKVPKLGSGWGA
jgi:hypothetical protein